MELTQLQFSQWSKGGEPRITLKYAGSGEDDEETVLLEVESSTPATFKGLYRTEISGEMVGPEEWDITIVYGPTAPVAWNSSQVIPEWSFSVDEETVHLTQSIATTAKYASSGTATDHKGAVNVQPDGSVEGYDSSVASLSWTETLYLPWAAWGPTYLAALKNCVGKWNSTAFRIWSAGEVLLRRARGKPAGQAYVQIEFDFLASENVTGLTVGDITGIDKRGWDLLWIEYEPVKDATANALAARPKHVYVEQVRYSANFSELLLPDPFA